MVLTPRALIERLMQLNLLHYGGALVARGLEVIGKFGLYMLAARLMGGHDSGLFFLCLTWVNLSSTAARMGLERAMSRHIAAELAVGHGHAARRAMLTGLGWTALASLAAAGLTLLVAEPAAHLLFHQDDLARPLMIAALILPPQTLAFAVGFVLVGLNRGVAAQMVQSALPPLLSLAALVAGLDRLDMVLSVYACSYTVCCLIGVGFIARDWHRKMIERGYTGETAPEALPSLWTTAWPFLTIELVQVSLLSLPVLMLGVFADARSVSEFSIVSRLTMLINTILVSMALIAAPAFARHHRRHEYEQLRRVERQTRLLAMAICLPAIAIMMIFPRLLLSLLGSDFTVASTALIVLALGQIVNTFLPTQDMMLSMTGHGRTLRRLNVQQLLVCLVLSAVLIPGFGLMGAAVLSTICLIQGRVSFALAVRRVLPELSAPPRPVAA
jgi:O-antigen/teichoic acid export membrane protein